ncbi:MAG: phage portal protein [Gammaproteobacteria bacterium]|nr:phage portal protein [Gammaproteobacteria bacterium]
MSEQLVKVKALGADIARPQTRSAGDEYEQLFRQIAGALEPPYDPDRLLYWVENSGALRPNIDSYVVNIDGFGHRVEPVIDFRADAVEDDVEAAIYARKVNTTGMEPDPLTDEQKKLAVEAFRRRARFEEARVTALIANAAYEPGESLIKLRKETRFDYEAVGYGAWEVLRNGRGEPARFKRIPPQLFRLMPMDDGYTLIDDFEWTSPVSFEPTSIYKRARRAAYISELRLNINYLKEFGDRRVMSPETGHYYESVEKMREVEKKPNLRPANEYIYFKQHFPGTPYGVPRWVGALPDVMGLYKAALVNLDYFENKSVPPLAVLVSGGRLADGAADRIERYIDDNIKGIKNFHKILIIEAQSDAKSSTAMRVEIKPLTNAQQQDALFLNYDERGTDKIGGQFRLPRILRGDVRDFNKATAEAALRTSEDQVFAPERDDFDHYMNARILPEWGISFYRFRSMTPVTRDPERLSKMITEQVKNGVLVPAEGRALAEDVFNRRFAPIKAAWAQQPITFTLAGIQTGTASAASGELNKGADPVALAKQVISVKDVLEREAAELAERRMRLARAGIDMDDDQTLVIEASSQALLDLGIIPLEGP